ncbi:D-aminoacyl-tRNA deacylase [Diplocloster agilis]|uniref:D-aminoacyl-tRNA deacylase n=1 Tax=Diplocloster agilis TaxID=2850323 RepID=UPI0008212EFA|nr:D-aminoacyl-tRNA deacylase [Suonthocola fibrivorans]MCU6733786.1 D-aminoacyl-tRNA deacylase [Suonthocola fibrivorans]SCJ08950.1 D-tyrosyl-tRNA(Tyr) deacylase [uncultured Clostridium sp.]
MRLVIQRVSQASVQVDGEIAGQIGRGLLVLAGVSDQDTKADVDKLVQKIIKLRIFEDENRKTNLSLKEVDGGLLIVSQFTLYADCRKGNRPSFTGAGSPALAKQLYEYMIEQCSKEVERVAHGIFGADMKVQLTNDGPFTIILDN